MPVDERTFVAAVAGWVNAILERRPDLPYGPARVEEHGVGGQKRHDFLLYRRGTQRVALTGEVKMPDSPMGKSPFDGALVEDAYQKASRRGVDYYFTWNVLEFVLFKTHQEGVPWMDRQIEGPTAVTNNVSVSDDVNRSDVQDAIRQFWESFLERFAALEAGRRTLQNLPLDSRFIKRLEAALEEPIFVTHTELARLYRQSPDFRSELNEWMVSEQGWDISESPELLNRNLERASRLSCYVLVTRLVFYEVLRKKFRTMSPLAGTQPRNSQEFKDILAVRFGEAINYSRDYQTVFLPEGFGASPPFLSPESPRAWLSVIQRIEDFDFSRLDFEIIGRLYEQLINPDERRQYGQFYTSPDVVDLINAFCIRSTDAAVLDPACGGGTFLVRAYARKRALALREGKTITHQQLLSQLFGVDIASFPAQLSTINMAVRQVSAESNYPQVARADFFNARRGVPLYHLPLTGNATRDIALPELDAVVSNPPYIRQEEIPREKKDQLTSLFCEEWPRQTLLSGRSDIYTHFFTHACAMLKPGGYLGFVTSIGWLDTEYGFRLQEFFLQNFRIIAVIESQVEKWFEDARVTTAVTILQREPSELARRSNLVRFIQLRKPLAQIYTEALHAPLSEESEAARQADMDAVRDLIEEITANQTTDYWRVRVLTQGALYEEGRRIRLDPGEPEPESTNYKGGKWGQYLRGPDVWFYVLDHAGPRMAPLQEFAEIKRGFTSGIDKFFCVRDVTDEELRRLPDAAAFQQQWGVSPDETKQVRIVRDGVGGVHLAEARFLEPEFHSLMEAKSIVIRAADVGRRVINAPLSRAALRRTRLADYVSHAERLGWHTGSTVASRARSRPWYDLGLRPKTERAPIFWPKAQQYRHLVPWNEDALPCKDRLYDVWPTDEVDTRLLWAALNSSIVVLAKHQFGRPAGIEGNLDTHVIDVNAMLVPDVRQASEEATARAISAAQQMAQRLTKRTLPEEFDLVDRQTLDDAVLEMLGYTNPAERVAIRVRIYAALSELYAATRARELIAQKDRLRSKRRGVVTPTDMADELWDEFHTTFGLLQFPDDFLRRQRRGITIDLPPGQVEVGTAMFDDARRPRAGTIRVGGPTGQVIEVGSVPRARFAAALSLCGNHGAVQLPEDSDCEEVLHEFEKYKEGLAHRFNALAAERTRDPRKRPAIVGALMRKALAWPRQP